MHKRHRYRNPSFAEVLEDFFNSEELGVRSWGRFPAANVQENEDNFVIELVVPGRNKEDIKIHAEKETLTISSDYQENFENENYQRREYRLSPFKRSFRLPNTADQENISAVYENGILKVSIAKKEVAKVQREIQIS